MSAIYDEFMLVKLMPDSINLMLTSVTSSLVALMTCLNKDALIKPETKTDAKEKHITTKQ
ncbi:7569_t:CDS:2 [Cetraspora pellucida]|uniref:7569_t:CDS:1 n=1 Tax=Cetraspora pellucida TaxID=1433469 RepID=A0A9N9HNS3_9GLOM|nr:7569_t:CDS:2 [Cetraspora pellucida]